MKGTTNLIETNIKNLTALWKTVGTAFDAYHKTPDFEYCDVKNSEWPNRLWLHQHITQDTIHLIKAKMALTASSITFPLWLFKNNDEDRLLTRNGFKLKFEQIGMSLKLDQPFEIKSDAIMQRVTNDTETQLWSTLFQKSFGYKISIETIIKTRYSIDYYIAYHNGIAIGTAILHKTNTIMGVHAVGIPPEMRRRGYAEQIMKSLINGAIKNGSEYVTLQASSMGKGLYLKLGFEAQFSIKNYVLNNL